MRKTLLKILIADHSPTDVTKLASLVAHLGHQPIVADDGQGALDLFQRESPDLVFMDIMMPGMDGIEAVRRIRALPSEKWTPIIFYSALGRDQDIVRGMEAGGDDYLVKPASNPLLTAKIGGYARLLDLRRGALNHTAELESWRTEVEEQTRLGAHVMERLTDAEGLRDSMVRHFNLPAETFSGDMLCAARAPGDVLNVMLADASGHGLAAALTAMPLTQIFYSMTAKGFPLSSIAEELNRKLKALLPADRFVAATLASVDVRNRTVEIWNGGNPDAIYLNMAGETCMQWISSHPPLGILPDKHFSGVTETVALPEPGDLVLCSDGLIEAEGAGGKWLGLEGVGAILRGMDAEADRIGALRRGVEMHLGGRRAKDDISCMMVSIPVERRREVRFTAPKLEHAGAVEKWRLALSYSAQELRYLDVVPAVLGFITQVNALKPHQGGLFLILSELFNNALDHGLLKLDSATKSLAGGFEIYLQQRAERLAGLDHGKIDLSFLLHTIDDCAVLDISLGDSGAGFDYQAWMDGNAAFGDEFPHGRGLALVRSLCSEVIFSGNGNKVWARFLL